MALPTQLDPTEQEALVKQIGLALLRAVPDHWTQVTVEYRAVGRYSELASEVTYADNETEDLLVPQEVSKLFGRLRAGMYREGRGTWFNARYRLDHPSNFTLDYDREEPEWDVPPPTHIYGDDLRIYPRTNDNVPDWLRRLVGMPADQGDRRFRMARIFDGMGPSGRPVVNRPPLIDRERSGILDYLDAAPVISLGPTLEIDRLGPEPRPMVPVAFHTDGSWIWPAAVNYYLRTYGVAPEPELVEHIRRMGFTVPFVDEATQSAATSQITRPGPPPAAGPPPAPPPPAPVAAPPPPAPPPPAPAPPPVTPPPVATLPPVTTTPPARKPPPEDEPVDLFTPAHPQPAHHSPPPPPRDPASPVRPALRPPPAALPSQGPPGLIVDQLKARLSALGVPGTAFQIGSPADRAWTMEQTEDGWRVGWYDGEFVAPAMFQDVADAAAFLLGKIMLDADRQSPPAAGGRRTAAPEPIAPNRPAVVDPPPPPEPPDSPPPPPVTVDPPPPPEPPDSPPARRPVVMDPPRPAWNSLPPPRRPEPQRDAGTAELRRLNASGMPDSGRRDTNAPARPPAHPAPALPVQRPVPRQPERRPARTGPEARPGARQPSQPSQQHWPVQPLPGEPPLTLFRGKRVVELAQGTEIDRFGDPDGNLTYAAGTPFSKRSLVPEWIHRTYHTYRVTRPIQAVTGTAIPWFKQDGGGTAYVLPDAIERLLDNGLLIEVAGREPPTR